MRLRRHLPSEPSTQTSNDAQIRMDDGRWDATTKTITWSANLPQPDGTWMRLLFTEKFEGDARRFHSVALTRKGEVPPGQHDLQATEGLKRGCRGVRS